MQKGTQKTLSQPDGLNSYLRGSVDSTALAVCTLILLPGVVVVYFTVKKILDPL